MTLVNVAIQALSSCICGLFVPILAEGVTFIESVITFFHKVKALQSAVSYQKCNNRFFISIARKSTNLKLVRSVFHSSADDAKFLEVELWDVSCWLHFLILVIVDWSSQLEVVVAVLDAIEL